MSEFAKEYVFNLYKNKFIGAARSFKYKLQKEHGATYEEAKELYVRLINYQIKTFGHVLDNGVTIERMSLNQFQQNPKHRTQANEGSAERYRISKLERKQEKRLKDECK